MAGVPFPPAPAAIRRPSASSTSWGAALPAGTPTYNHIDELFRTGTTADNNIQVSGGNDRTSFYSSIGLTNQLGVVKGPNNKYNRASFRLKGSQEVGSKITLSGNFNYVDSRGNFVQHGNDVSGLLLGALRTPPAFDNLNYLTDRGLQRPYRFPNPTSVEAFGCCAYYDNPFFVINSPGNRSELGRTISNFNVDWRPLSWLSVKETLGGDYYSDSRLQALPLTSANDAAGSVIRAEQTNLVIDHNLIASATGSRGENLNGTLTIGQNLNSRRYRSLSGQGEGLIAPVPLAIENTVSQTGLEFKSLRHIESYFGQGELNLYNQLYLSAGVRNDGFSTFGASQRRHNFYKASAAWTLSNLLNGGDQTGLLSFAKLRAAYGETGREPDVYAALNALSTITQFGSGYGDALKSSVGGVPGITSSTRVGNPALRPSYSARSSWRLRLSESEGRSFHRRLQQEIERCDSADHGQFRIDRIPERVQEHGSADQQGSRAHPQRPAIHHPESGVGSRCAVRQEQGKCDEPRRSADLRPSRRIRRQFG